MLKEERIKPLYKLPEQLDDENELQELHELQAKYDNNQEIDILDELTPEQYQRLMKASEDMDKGLGISLEELWANIDEWRTKFKSTYKSKKK